MKIRTRAYDEGFRRGGVAHSKEWKEWPGEKFSNEQIEAMHEEPRLMMQIIEEDGEDILGVDEFAGPLVMESAQVNDLLEAARQAVSEGKIIGSGAPSVDAIQDILGRDVTSAERDEAWATIKAEA